MAGIYNIILIDKWIDTEAFFFTLNIERNGGLNQILIDTKCSTFDRDELHDWKQRQQKLEYTVHI
jgi:hypothetical protein